MRLASALEAADHGFPVPRRDRVPVNCTVPAVSPGRAVAIVTAPHGCTTAKVKVAEPGQSLDDDVDRVAAVRAAMGPAARIRVDANGGWGVDEAVRAIERLSEFGLEYVEQPTATIEGLAAVRRRVDVPIAAGTKIDPPGPRTRCGSPASGQPTSRCSRSSRSAGCGSAWRSPSRSPCQSWSRARSESSVGIAAGRLALAAALPELPYACGLATAAMFRYDLADPPLLPVDGTLPVGRVAPDDHLLDAARADAGEQPPAGANGWLSAWPC